MPRNGAGQYTPPTGTFGVTGTPISPTAYDAFVNDLSTELTNSLNVQGTAPMLAPLNMGGYKVTNGAAPVAATDFVIKSYVDSVIPPGAVFWFASNTPPTGYLECDGSSVSTTTYAALFAIVAYTFGGSGTSFNLPDLRGQFIRGWDHGRGQDTNTPSRVFGSNEAAANITHTHTTTQTGHSHGITDPTHNHAQSAHSHGVTDPTHAHIIPNGALGAGVNLAAGSGFNLNTANATSAAATGISINAANANISAAATGVSVNAANANITVVAQGSSEVTVKNTALLPCIKF
jgi:microcystin-dependent protein